MTARLRFYTMLLASAAVLMLATPVSADSETDFGKMFEPTTLRAAQISTMAVVGSYEAHCHEKLSPAAKKGWTDLFKAVDLGGDNGSAEELALKLLIVGTFLNEHPDKVAGFCETLKTKTLPAIEESLSLLLAGTTGTQEEEQTEKKEQKEICPHPKGWAPTADEMQRILADHAQWVQTWEQESQKQGFAALAPPEWVTPQGRANLCNVNWREIKIEEAHLQGAKLNNADLSWAQLNKANLTWAQLNKANLTWAQLNNADLKWAQLNNADLVWAKLNNVDLKWAQLNNANLFGAELNNVDLKWA